MIVGKEVPETESMLGQFNLWVITEVPKMKVFLTDTIWPEVNKTMVDLRQVLVTSIKVLVLLAALGAAHRIHNLTTARANVPRGRVVRNVEDTGLRMAYFLCVIMAVVLTLVTWSLIVTLGTTKSARAPAVDKWGFDFQRECRPSNGHAMVCRPLSGQTKP